MAQHNDIGKWGEQLARDYLVSQGYAIFESNLRSGHNELDIIAFRGDTVAFVEVKTRTTSFSDPLEAIDTKKIRRLARAADSFLRAYNIIHEPRFDVITIVGSPDTSHTLTHYPDAIIPPLSGAR
ncbi:MAG: YraN family protein [Bacteroides sp.]|nr:YraN family protein [Bacteroides sp.]